MSGHITSEQGGPGGTQYIVRNLEHEVIEPTRMRRFKDYLESSIGAKQIMALTGAILWGYLLVHIAGNMQMFQGPARFNGYAEFLKGTAILLWGERVVVFGSIVLHAWAGVRVTKLNRAARPERYHGERATASSTPMSRTMIASGVVILAFFIFHILHFTVGAVGNASFVTETVADGHVRADAWTMVYSAFKRPAIVAFYVIGMIFLFAHLAHGTVSLFQTIGLYSLFRSRKFKIFCYALAVVLTVAASSIPLAIYTSWAPFAPG